MRILALNCGSSSVKFGVLDVSARTLRSLISGEASGIGGASTLELRASGKRVSLLESHVADHAEAVQWVMECLEARNLKSGEPHLLASLNAVGHRVVHGGDGFQAPVRIDDAVLKQ